jgi:apolipoprotein N-acyltransferase
VAAHPGKSRVERTAHALSDFADRVRGVRGWRRHGLVLAAGGLSTLSQPPFLLWPVLLVTFPLLCWQIEGARRGNRPGAHAASAAFGFAFGYFFFGLSWIGEAFLVEAEIFAWLLPFAITLLPMAMSFYWAAAAVATLAMWHRIPACQSDDASGAAARVLAMAIAFSIAEWVRGFAFTGFPWHAPGLALTAPLELMQSASLVGMQGLTAVAFAVLTLPAMAIAASGRDGVWRALAIIGLGTALPLAAMYGFGLARLAAAPSPAVEGVKIRIVQPSVPQRDKWRADKQGQIFSDHLDLSRQNASGRVDDMAGISHVVWPEAAMPFGPLANPDALAAIGHLLPDGVHLLAGALRRDDATGRVYNSLLVLDGNGALAALYDKIHLVPFGEYLPFPQVLESIGLQNLVRQRGGFAAGPSPRPLLSAGRLPPFAPIICYEAIFPGEIVQGAQRPGLLVIVTNDGWFGNSIGPAQHFHQARVRAVEQGISVVRSANNGISAVIDPEGRVIARLDLNQRGTIDSDVPKARLMTPMASLGPFGLAAVVTLFFSCLAIMGRPLLRRTLCLKP